MALHRGIVASGIAVLVPSAPAAPTVSLGTGATTTDRFTWIAPADNGGAITKYGYQTSTDDGSTWSAETEQAGLTKDIDTAYTTSSYKLRVRAFNSAGWGPYSLKSTGGTGAWTSNTGTDSQSQTDTGCSTGTCSEGCSCGACSCGSNNGTRTRTSTRSRSRSRSTQYWSRTNSNNSSTTYGSFSISDYEWNLGASSTVGWGALSYGDWSGCGSCSGCGSWNITDGSRNDLYGYPQYLQQYTGGDYRWLMSNASWWTDAYSICQYCGNCGYCGGENYTGHFYYVYECSATGERRWVESYQGCQCLDA